MQCGVLCKHFPSLCQTTSEDEIWLAIQQISLWKALGRNGLTGGFFQHFSYVIKSNIVKHVQDLSYVQKI